MLIGKETEHVLNSDLLVDSWIVKHELNLETGEAELIDNYVGPIPIEKVKEQKQTLALLFQVQEIIWQTL